MDKKFAYIVAASKNYTLGLKALLNSLKVHGNEADVILLLHGFEDEDVLAFKKYDFRVIAVKIKFKELPLRDLNLLVSME